MCNYFKACNRNYWDLLLSLDLNIIKCISYVISNVMLPGLKRLAKFPALHPTSSVRLCSQKWTWRFLSFFCWKEVGSCCEGTRLEVRTFLLVPQTFCVALDKSFDSHHCSFPSEIGNVAFLFQIVI